MGIASKAIVKLFRPQVQRYIFLVTHDNK